MNKKRNPNAFVTNKVLDGAVDYLVFVIHDVFQELKTYMDKRFSKSDKHFSKIDKHFGNLESGQRDMKRQLNDLKVDTPTMKEFNALKARQN